MDGRSEPVAGEAAARAHAGGEGDPIAGMRLGQPARLELDELPEQLVAQARDVQRMQSRLRGYLAVDRGVDLDDVLRHILAAGRDLVDASCAALRVIEQGMLIRSPHTGDGLDGQGRGGRMSAPAGSVVADRYKLTELVGRGGMARVWRAHDTRLRRDVAVKEIVAPPGWTAAEQATLQSLALREAQAAAQITHPHAVRIYDVIDTADGPWIVMEYVSARSLHEIVDQRGPLAPPYVATIGVAVLDALAAAHAAGVLHRDVKPRNVLVGNDGRVLLTDFGIAMWDAAGANPSGLVGTAQYLPPERVDLGVSLPEGDLWSLGATLYSAVEGRAPYARATIAATLAALVTAPPDPPRYAGKLGPILCALLQRDPTQRPRAAEARRRLLRIATSLA